MPWEKIPVSGDPYKNVDEVSLDDKSTALIDGYVDEVGNTNKRPGLEQFCSVGTNKPIYGLYWWNEGKCAIAVSDQRIFKISASDGTFEEITGTSLLNPNTRPTFVSASDGSGNPILLMANGGSILYYDNSGDTQLVSDVDAPGLVTHVDYMDNYVVANSLVDSPGNRNRNKIFNSNAGNALNWSASAFNSANAKMDNITALSAGWRNLLVIGETTTEVWYIDSSGNFYRYQGAYIERGSLSPYSVAFSDNTWFWLDHTRRFVRIDGVTPKVVSTPFDKIIQGYSDVADVTADLIEVDGRNFVVFNFPSADKTLVYNYALKVWQEWSYWVEESNSRERWLGNCHCWASSWNKHLVGSRKPDGIIYNFSSSVYKDGSDKIRTVRRTGFNSYNTNRRKKSKEVVVRLKRGVGNASVSNPQMMVRWRDADNMNWSNEVWVDLMAVGNYEFMARLYRLGTYRARQWEFALTDEVDFVLVNAEESVEVLE